MNKNRENNNSGDFRWRDLVCAYWFLLQKSKWKWLGLTLLLFVINLYVVVPAFILGKIVDFFTQYRAGDSLKTFYIFISVLGVSFMLVSFFRLSLKNVLGNIQSDVRYETKVRGFEKLLDFSLAWHLEETAGTKAQRIQNGIESYQILNRRLTNEIMRAVASILGVIGVFIFLRPQYVIFFVLYVVGFWMILHLFYNRIQKENDSYFSSVEKAGGSYVEGLSNILTIKTLGADADFKNRIAEKESLTRDHEFVLRKLYSSLWKSFHALNGTCYGIFLFLVGQDVIAQTMTAGSLVIFYGYLQSLIGSSSDMLDTYETILNAKSGIGRMMSIFWAKTSIRAGKKTFPKHWKNITLNHAHFSYTISSELKNKKIHSQKTLQDITLAIPRYAKIGIVGKTGSGKSTLAKILAGLYPLASGIYKISDISFYELAHDEQTQNITLVLQETEIFNLSLRENITLMRKLDENFLEKAVSIAQLEDVIQKLPQGLETLVGEKGYHLSGGERQRVGIARALYKNSPIMIFDEATSSLDRQTESRIQQALETQLQDKTLILIAHRISTLEQTDRIYVFDEGAIVEEGTFFDLSKNPQSKFYELSRAEGK